MEADTKAELERIVDEALARLAEHFEVVEIFASRVEADGTRCIKRGMGNWYARQGIHVLMKSQNG